MLHEQLAGWVPLQGRARAGYHHTRNIHELGFVEPYQSHRKIYRVASVDVNPMEYLVRQRQMSLLFCVYRPC